MSHGAFGFRLSDFVRVEVNCLKVLMVFKVLEILRAPRVPRVPRVSKIARESKVLAGFGWI